MALGKLPKRVKEIEHVPFDREKIPVPGEKDVNGTDRSGEEGKSDKGKERESEKPPLTGIQLEYAKARSVLNANIGACYVNQVRMSNYPFLFHLSQLYCRKSTRKLWNRVQKVT